MSNLTTILGWTAILSISGAVFYLSKRTTPGGRQQNNKVDRRSDLAPQRHGKRSESNTGDHGVSSGNEKSSIDKKSKSKKKPKTKPTTAIPSSKRTIDQKTPAPTIREELYDSDAGDDDDAKFAQDFVKVQSGQVAPSKSQTSTKQKSSKLSKLEKDVPSGASGTSAQSSDLGAEDDLSHSELASESYLGNNGISDMLEAPSAGPSSLKINAPTKSTPEKKKVTTPSESALTKTQKKNRKKNEEKAAENQAAEAERKAMLEAHRRQVRIAEGRPAKDGTAFLAANPPKQTNGTGWSTVANGKADTARPAVKEELLDTFETQESQHAIPSAAETEHNSSAAGGDYNEDVSRAIHESLTQWEEVAHKKNKKNNSKSLNKAQAVNEAPAQETRAQPVDRPVEVVTPATTR